MNIVIKVLFTLVRVRPTVKAATSSKDTQWIISCLRQASDKHSYSIPHFGPHGCAPGVPWPFTSLKLDILVELRGNRDLRAGHLGQQLGSLFRLVGPCPRVQREAPCLKFIYFRSVWSAQALATAPSGGSKEGTSVSLSLALFYSTWSCSYWTRAAAHETSSLALCSLLPYTEMCAAAACKWSLMSLGGSFRLQVSQKALR